MCPSLIEIRSKTAEKNCTNKQTDRHYDNNGHLAVNQYSMHMPESPTRRGTTVDRPRCPLRRMLQLAVN